MVRAPCCEKMGLKKGPWTAEEDQILVSHIQRHGHGNWRALPKQAGLLRCGKSCRLRWINYLRPDIKRGNFTLEEEEAIIKLHEMLGNRWSAIAAKLPGRTDNEIKNIWHTYLKKRVSCPDSSSSQRTRRKLKTNTPKSSNITIATPTSSLQSSFSTYQFSNSSSGTTTDVSSNLTTDHQSGEDQYFCELPVIDESFWSEEHLPMEESMTNRASMDSVESDVIPLFSSCGEEMNDDMDFWLNVLLETRSS